ncbi:hypothetical protein E2986_13234 [Frieseomelitta varia]|uniref:Uncharacterized protein n=1 Tax=Frieseomelitta varia TaxID=561572 RepID=A0A833S7C5_9HYME|nr:hypothetical protein E2986_13234 [Frieseomelitta varia]
MAEVAISYIAHFFSHCNLLVQILQSSKEITGSLSKVLVKKSTQIADKPIFQGLTKHSQSTNCK